MDNPDFIVIEGPIGVGKTTLAKKLAKSFNTEMLLEGADENPFMTTILQKPKSRSATNTVVLPVATRSGKCRTYDRAICFGRCGWRIF